MVEISDIKDDLVHLSRLGLDGNVDDVRLFLSRFARKLKKKDADLYAQLSRLLKDYSPLKKKSILRKANTQITPQIEQELSDEMHDLLLTPDVSEIEKPILSEFLTHNLRQLLLEFTRRDELIKARISPTRSGIFTGPPGVGKTHTAKWIASQLGLPLYILDVATVMSSLLGGTGVKLRKALNYAKANPCVLLLDEIDSIAKKRSDESDVGELKRLVTVILQEVDGWDSSSLLLAATNHKELIDPALWRRFDWVFEFDMPESNQIELAIKRYFESDLIHFEKYIKIFGACHFGMSFSDIEKSIDNIRKARFLDLLDDEELVEKMVIEKVDNLPKNQRIIVATELMNLKENSQRKISAITGVSRDTIRKKTAACS